MLAPDVECCGFRPDAPGTATRCPILYSGEVARPILVRGARQLLTLQGSNRPRRGAELNDLGVIVDGAVLIVDGIIREVGPTRRLENLAIARQAVEIDAAGRVVLPGFVDSHTHLVGGPARLPRRDDAASLGYDRLLGGDVNMIGDLSARALEASAIRILKDCLRQGTTTLEAKSGHGYDEAGELRILKVHSVLEKGPVSVVSTFMGARFLPRAEIPLRAEYINWLCDHMLPLVARRRLAEFVDIQCEEGAFNLDQARRVLLAARNLGFGLKMHAGQFWDMGAVGLGVEMGVTSLDHLIYLHETDMERLAESDTIATLLPGGAFYLGYQRYAPARALIDRGVAVALATNYNVDTSPSQSMQTMIGLACRRLQMGVAEAISAATINGAHALRRGDQIGSLEIGKDANLLILGVSDYREIVQNFGINLVEMTMKEGRVVHRQPDVEWPAA